MLFCLLPSPMNKTIKSRLKRSRRFAKRYILEMLRRNQLIYDSTDQRNRNV